MLCFGLRHPVVAVFEQPAYQPDCNPLRDGGARGSPGREAKRAINRDYLVVGGFSHFWWEDEIGTEHDPIRGPHPVSGPKARAG